MRGRVAKWFITLLIFLAVPVALVWGFMPFLDVSHATYLCAQGDYQAALRALNRAIRFNPNLATAYTRRGWVFAKLGNYERSLADFSQAIKLADNDWEAFNDRAMIVAQMPNGNLKQALDDANEALSLCAACAPAYDTRGFIQMKSLQFDRAINDFNRAIDLNGRFAEAYYHRALCYEKMNQPDNAGRDRLRAHEFGYYDDATWSPAGAASQAVAFPLASR